jgi:PKHD-type hydroxylase
MSSSNTPSTLTYAVWSNGFSQSELDAIEDLGDRLTIEKAGLQERGRPEGQKIDSIRICRTAWIGFNDETKWLYERVQQIAAALNNQVYQFDLRGFSEQFQYTVYRDCEGGHYTWHVDQGPLTIQRKLSFTLQLTDPSSYEGGELQFFASHEIETAPKERGAMVAFPAYVLHRVTPVTSGTRKSVVIWTTGQKFR